jgi:hypothetical protein
MRAYYGRALATTGSAQGEAMADIDSAIRPAPGNRTCATAGGD